MADAVSLLREKEAKLAGKVKRTRATLEAMETELNETAIAIRVLSSLGLSPEIEEEQADAGMTAPQAAVLAAVPYTRELAVAPRDIFNAVRANGAHADLTSDYVRTALWRMATKKNLIKSEDGLYWREAQHAENVEAPDAETSEASEIAGPLGGERGYPPSAPEGSIPSGSTHVQPESFDTDLDDDVPF
jgi:hypothetical protein